MRSTFFGLNIGRRSMQTQQRALDVTSQNIANANTPGFTRQDAVLATTTPYPVPSLNRPWGAGQIGTGVEIAEIRRLRDGFLDLQFRNESKTLGYWEAHQDAIQKIEVIINEPSDSGLRTVFELFWQSLQGLSKDGESLPARSLVYERAGTLTETFNHLDRKLLELQEDLDSALKIKVDEVNSIGKQIADLNQQILKVEVAGQRANDLRDKRDILLDQVSKIINVQIHEGDLGVVQVGIGGRFLVQGAEFNPLVAVGNQANDTFSDVCWKADGKQVEITDGAMRGLVEMRGYLEAGQKEGLIREIRNGLNELAKTLAEEFNTVHRAGCGLNGSTGTDFFVNNGGEMTAGNIIVNPDLADLNKIAASVLVEIPASEDPADYENKVELGGVWYTWDKGGGDTALLLAQLKQDKTMKLPGNTIPTGTFEDYYQALIGELGVVGQQSIRMVENQELLVSQLENNRQAVSGVSLDEEMINMISFQHAYNAAARVITTMDEMIDLIISRMGLVGR